MTAHCQCRTPAGGREKPAPTQRLPYPIAGSWEMVYRHLESPAQAGRAFSLIEVTLALSVAAFCLVAILGLLQTGLTTQRATTEQTAATGIVSMIFSDLLATEGTNRSPRFQIELVSPSVTPQTLFFAEGGQHTTSLTSDSRYRASLDVRPPTGNSKAATGVRILVTWPAAADPSPTGWPSKHAGSVETWTSFARN